jgi:2-iminobutanoate/2-iminopropanoate deaminase
VGPLSFARRRRSGRRVGPGRDLDRLRSRSGRRPALRRRDDVPDHDPAPPGGGDRPKTRQANQTKVAPAALGPYSQAIRSGDTVYCSGQLGLDASTGELADGVAAQAERALKNLASVLDAAGLSFDDVVKTTIFLADIGDFAAVNDVYGAHMPDPPPARSTIGVGALPKGALVEIEMIARRAVADAVADRRG